MKIKREMVERTTIEKFAEKHRLTMEVHERIVGELPHITANDRFYAHFEDADIKDGCVLIGTFGNGPTEEDAIRDYAREISGKLLVIDARGESRKEIECPIFTD